MANVDLLFPRLDGTNGYGDEQHCDQQQHEQKVPHSLFSPFSDHADSDSLDPNFQENQWYRGSNFSWYQLIGSRMAARQEEKLDGQRPLCKTGAVVPRHGSGWMIPAQT